MEHESIPVAPNRWQFSIAAIFEYTTVCGVLAAFAWSSGVASCVFLMAMALALGARQGGLAVAMLIAASIAVNLRLIPAETGTVESRQLAVFLLAAALCAWYRLRRNNLSAAAPACERLGARSQ